MFKITMKEGETSYMEFTLIFFSLLFLFYCFICRAWVPVNNCYLMSKEIPFSVKKTKSIFNSAMQEMEVYVENIRRKFGVFNYAPFRTPYTPNNQYQMLLDPSNPGAGTAKTDKQEKIKLNFDMTASPKILMSKPMLSSSTGRRISVTDMPRSPMSTNSSVHTGSDVEQDAEKKASHFSASEESMDFIDKSTGKENRRKEAASIATVSLCYQTMCERL